MTFTGPNGDTLPSSRGDVAAIYPPAFRRVEGVPSRSPWARRGAPLTVAPVDPVSDAMQRTADWLRGRQAADGHWRAPLEGDTILESEYLLLLAWAGRLDAPEVGGCVRRILDQQLPGGGWAIYPGGPVDVSASVKA